MTLSRLEFCMVTSTFPFHVVHNAPNGMTTHPSVKRKCVDRPFKILISQAHGRQLCLETKCA